MMLVERFGERTESCSRGPRVLNWAMMAGGRKWNWGICGLKGDLHGAERVGAGWLYGQLLSDVVHARCILCQLVNGAEEEGAAHSKSAVLALHSDVVCFNT